MGDLEKMPARTDAVESQILQLRGEMRDGFSAIDRRIQEGSAETRRHMLVLHEEVLRRISLLKEG